MLQFLSHDRCTRDPYVDEVDLKGSQAEGRQVRAVLVASYRVDLPNLHQTLPDLCASAQ